MEVSCLPPDLRVQSTLVSDVGVYLFVCLFRSLDSKLPKQGPPIIPCYISILFILSLSSEMFGKWKGKPLVSQASSLSLGQHSIQKPQKLGFLDISCGLVALFTKGCYPQLPESSYLCLHPTLAIIIDV
jgi:hypothetical protein